MSSSKQQRNGATLPSYEGGPYLGSSSSSNSNGAVKAGAGFGRLFTQPSHSSSSEHHHALPTPPSPAAAAYTHHYGSSNRAATAAAQSHRSPPTQPLSSPGFRHDGSSRTGTGGGGMLRPHEHVGLAPTPPARPPKPAALRVKKAKAYSISLLAGSTAPFARAAGAAGGKGATDYGAGRSSEEASPRQRQFAELAPAPPSRVQAGSATRFEDTQEEQSRRIARMAGAVRGTARVQDDGAPVHIIGREAPAPPQPTMRSHSNSTPLPVPAQLRPPVLPPRLPGAGSSGFLGSLSDASASSAGTADKYQDWLLVSSYDNDKPSPTAANLQRDLPNVPLSPGFAPPAAPSTTATQSSSSSKPSEAQSYAASFAAALDSPALSLGDTLRAPGLGRTFERSTSAGAGPSAGVAANEEARGAQSTDTPSDYGSASKRSGRRKASLGSASIFDGLLRSTQPSASRSPTTPSAPSPVEPFLNAHTVVAGQSVPASKAQKRKLPPVVTPAYKSNASGAHTAPLVGEHEQPTSFGTMQSSASNPLTATWGAPQQQQRTMAREPYTEPPSPAKSDFGLRFGIKSKSREGSATVDPSFTRAGGGGAGGPFNARFMRSSDQLNLASSYSEQGHGVRTGGGAIQPPPQRRTRDSWRDSDTHSLAGYSGGGGGGGGAAVVHALGQMGVAVGKKGWDMMRSWNSNQAGAAGSGAAGYAEQQQLGAGAGGAYGQRNSVAPDINAATRKWLNAPDASATSSRATAGAKAQTGVIFGATLRDAVIATRLGNVPVPGQLGISFNPSSSAAAAGKTSRPLSQLDALDLGSDFHVPLSLDGSSPVERGAHAAQLSRSGTARQGRSAASRAEARMRYLPAVVVRCIEALEKWGADEEGIYRLSGRSSHTAKLRLIFDVLPSYTTGQIGDLKLDDIGPADLDLNSVCSLLKHYLRELPEPLLTKELGAAFDRAAVSAAGTPATGAASGGMFGGASSAAGVVASGSAGKIAGAAKEEVESLSSLIATAVKPLIRKLPACNWYLLRELAEHLGDLCKPEVVKHTKMPLSNLSLVIAPTMSLSVVMVRALVEHRTTLFGGDGPTPDPELDGPLASEATALLAPSDARSTPPGWSVVHGHGNTSTPRQSAYASYDTTVVREIRPPLPSRETNRSSTHTVTAATPADDYAKRESVATLRGTFEGDNEPAPPTPSVPPPLRSMKNSRQPMIVLADGDGIDDAAAPIAARFQRQRTLSSATTLSAASPQLGQPLKAQGSSSSLASKNGSGNGSGKLRIGGDDASSSSNGHGWDGSDAGHSTASHDSMAGSISALSRPRPPTSGGTRFFASKATSGVVAPALPAPAAFGGARTRRAGTGQSMTPSTDSHGSMGSSSSPHGPSFGSQANSGSTFSTSTSMDSHAPSSTAAAAMGQRKRGNSNNAAPSSTPASPAPPYGFASSKSDLSHSHAHANANADDGLTDLDRLLQAQHADAGVEARRKAYEAYK